jgi:acyl carrier protein
MTKVDNYSAEQPVVATPSIAIPEMTGRPSCAEIVEWCREYVARTLGVAVAKVEPDAEFDALGFDSAAAVALVVEVGEWLNLDLEPAALFDYPTISAFADYIAKL